MAYWLRLFASVLSGLSIGACAANPVVVEQWADPFRQTLENASYRIVFEPLKKSGKTFRTFSLTLENKTSGDIEIDWNRTRYVHNQRHMGGFVFTGIDPAQTKAGTIPADRVTAGETFQREIAPQRLIAFAPMRDKAVAAGKAGISAGPLPEGRSGIALSLRVDGKDVRENLAVDIAGGSY